MRYENLISSCVLCQIFVQSCQTVDNDVTPKCIHCHVAAHRSWIEKREREREGKRRERVCVCVCVCVCARVRSCVTKYREFPISSHKTHPVVKVLYTLHAK